MGFHIGHALKKITGKVEHAFKKGAGIILPAAAAAIGFMVGGPAGAAVGANIGTQLGGDEIAAKEMAKKSSSSDTTTTSSTSSVDETEIVTPTQNYTTDANTNSDVGFGDVMSIFDDKDEDDPFKALL